MSASSTWAASWPTCTDGALGRERLQHGRRPWRRVPVTGMPRASMIRATPDMPAPPMARKCTRPSVAGVGDVGAEVEAGCGRVVRSPLRGSARCRAALRARASTMSARRSSASRSPERAARAAHREQPLAVGGEGQQVRRRPTRG